MNKLITGLLIFMCMTLAAQTNRSYPPPKVSNFLYGAKLSLADLGLKGRVKTYRGYEWSLAGASPWICTWSFDQRGQVTSLLTEYRSESETGYRYDSAGNLIESYDALESYYGNKFSYDSAGYLSQITEYTNGNEIYSKTEFIYQDTTYVVTKTNNYGRDLSQFDSQGRPVSMKSFDSKGLLTDGKDFEYFPNDFITIIYTGWDQGNHTGKTIEKRNDKGLLIETTSYNSKGEIVDYHVYIYDAEGRCITCKGKNYSNDDIRTATYDYIQDEMGNVIKVISKYEDEDEPFEPTWEIEYY